jgi:membrane-bound serine protease (ClpP class)
VTSSAIERWTWGRLGTIGRAAGAVAVALGVLLPAAGATAAADVSPPVYLVEISGDIDLGLAPLLARTVSSATDADAAAVVLVIDTPGGRLDAVLQMRDTLLGSPVRTIAYVDRTAFSAGALIAIAAEELHMAPGAVMGAATPVDASGIPADAKVISAVRSTFEATAEERGRDPLIAEAMVDAGIAIPGLTEAGSLLTLTVSEAQRTGYADGVAADLPSLLTALGLEEHPLVRIDATPAERLVRFITNPVIASLLITLGVLLLLGDLLSGGVGVGAAAGVALLGTFFWGHLLAGLSGWEDVVLVVIGIGLLVVELLVVPGFGVPGALGLAAVLGGVFLATINRDLEVVGTAQLLRSGTIVAVSLIGIVVGLVALFGWLSRRGGPPGLVLRSSPPVASTADREPDPQPGPRGWLRWFGDGSVLETDRPAVAEAAAEAAAAATAGALTGARGVALSDLRPAGVAEIGGRRIDVVTDGEYLAAGDAIEVLRDEGYRRVVRRPRR